MSQVTVSRQVDLSSLPWPASQRWDGVEAVVVAHGKVSESELRAAVDAAPDLAEPADRVTELTARLDAVAALAERADATAQEVAQAARDGQAPTRR